MKEDLGNENMAISAFEQFEILRIIPLGLGKFDISITNSTIFMVLAVLYWVVIYKTNVEKGGLVPSRWQSVIEIVHDAMFDVVKDNIGKTGQKYLPFILTIFMLIGMMNIVGIVPYTFTPTSHIVVTFGLSLSIFIGVTLLGFRLHGSEYLSMFMPGGSPLVMAPFLVIIELVSHFAKAISLGVRLAANIIAGHLLFAILSGFTWTMLTAGGLTAVAAIFPLFIVLFITVLEMGVALIQAYVFTTLTSIYISESEHLH